LIIDINANRHEIIKTMFSFYILMNWDIETSINDLSEWIRTE
jgi:hypothetical protein